VTQPKSAQLVPPPPGCTARSGHRPAASRRHTHTSWVGTEGQIGAVNDESWVAVDLSEDLSCADAGVAIEKIKIILLHPYRYATIPWFKCCCCCKLLSPNTPLQAAAATAVQLFKCSAWTMATGWPCHGQAPRRRPVASPAASVLLGRTCPPRRRRGVVRLWSRLTYTYRLLYLAKTRPTPRPLPAAFFLRGTLMAPSPAPPRPSLAAALRIIQTEC
jgi:hypothetical protein